ncbi:MAG: hypothetical protein GXY85_03325 [Candidatus Brocadiaceae bacterium]|nr:hypothetical protein [Candidatus Brocadiaceae bacterium]
MPGPSRTQLIWMAQTLHTMLDAGVPIGRVLDVMTRQAPTAGVRHALTLARGRIDQGATLAEALGEQRRFPPLFVGLLDAGERSGTLERTAGELARYYEFRQRLWSRFRAQITLPVVQYVVAVAVIGLATHILAMLADRPSRAGWWLLVGYGLPPVLVLAYRLAAGALGGLRLVHEVVLHVPVVGRAARAVALARFSFVFLLLYEAAFPVVEALRRALEGTGNAAFAARSGRTKRAIEDSGSLTSALRATGLFPEDYLQITAVAEESGKLSERFAWLASHYAERAERTMHALAVAAGWAVWSVVAAIIIVFIFRFFCQYVRMLG